MPTHDNGGPAFPSQVHGRPIEGMTLRDYFAGQAMKSLLEAQGMVGTLCREEPDECADRSYTMADAMLKRRGHL